MAASEKEVEEETWNTSGRLEEIVARMWNIATSASSCCSSPFIPRFVPSDSPPGIHRPTLPCLSVVVSSSSRRTRRLQAHRWDRLCSFHCFSRN